MRILHTADWHLGHSLHGVQRDYEHGRFLDWLLDTLVERRADVLLIAGDIFDSANPPASAQAMLYRFLVEAGRRLPRLQTVLIAGNHDSAARLEAPSPILDALKVRVVGAVRRGLDGRLETERLLFPLEDATGRVAAWCAAVPFLRPADLRVPGVEAEADDDLASEGPDPLAAGVAALYAEALAALDPLRAPDQALVALGHCYMVGTRLSDLSERKILGGNQHALPSQIFPESVTYAALGHLHLAQAVGQRRELRYSGSPIPLALDERRYPHQVLEIELESAELRRCESLPIPRFVEILRIPEQGAAPAAEVEHALAALELDPELPPERHPYLEIAVQLDRPDPGLRQRIEAAIDGRAVRLLKLSTQYAGESRGLSAERPAQRLAELKPESVFRERYRQQFGDDPPEPLLSAFHELLEAVEGSGT